MLPIVQSGATNSFFIQVKAVGLDENESLAQARASAADRASVAWDFGSDEHDSEFEEVELVTLLLSNVDVVCDTRHVWMFVTI